MFELGIFMYRTGNSVNNLSSYCGLVDAKIRASDKDLPVINHPVLSAPTRKIILEQRGLIIVNHSPALRFSSTMDKNCF